MATAALSEPVCLFRFDSGVSILLDAHRNTHALLLESPWHGIVKPDGSYWKSLHFLAAALCGSKLSADFQSCQGHLALICV